LVTINRVRLPSCIFNEGYIIAHTGWSPFNFMVWKRILNLPVLCDWQPSSMSRKFCISLFCRAGGPVEEGYYQFCHDDLSSTYYHHFYNSKVFFLIGEQQCENLEWLCRSININCTPDDLLMVKTYWVFKNILLWDGIYYV
jgi:hypothetical protein